MVGLDHMGAGMDVDVAAGVECQKYAPRSSGTARSAVLGTGGVVQIADTVRVSRTMLRMLRRPQYRRKLQSWRRRQLVWATTSLFWLAKEFSRKNSKNSKGNSTARRTLQSTSESAKLAEMRENLRVRKETLRVAHEEFKILREDLLREGESMDNTRATSCLRRTRKKFEFSASKRPAGRTRDGSVEEIAGWLLEAQRLNREVEAKKRKLQEAIEKESGKDARMGDDSMDGLDGSLSS